MDSDHTVIRNKNQTPKTVAAVSMLLQWRTKCLNMIGARTPYEDGARQYRFKTNVTNTRVAEFSPHKLRMIPKLFRTANNGRRNEMGKELGPFRLERNED